MTSVTFELENENNETIRELEYSFLIQIPVYNFGYRIAGYCLFVIGGPVLLLTIFNIFVIVKIRKATRERKEMQRYQVRNLGRLSWSQILMSNRAVRLNSVIHKTQYEPQKLQIQERNAFRISASSNPNNFQYNQQPIDKWNQNMLEITRICIIILLSYTVCESPPLFSQILLTIQEERIQSLAKLILPLSNVCATLNSGINFYIYVFFGRRFRRHLTEICQYAKCGLGKSGLRISISVQNGVSTLTKDSLINKDAMALSEFPKGRQN